MSNLIKRSSNISKYQKTVQCVFDGWAAVRTASSLVGATGSVGTREEFASAVNEYIISNAILDLKDFGFMYVMLKKRGYPEEVIADIASYFERGATFDELCEAYMERS